MIAMTAVFPLGTTSLAMPVPGYQSCSYVPVLQSLDERAVLCKFVPVCSSISDSDSSAVRVAACKICASVINKSGNGECVI